MKGNKIGNYKFFRTIGEGAFAKVKRKLFFIIPIIINIYSRNSRNHWSKSRCENFTKI